VKEMYTKPQREIGLSTILASCQRNYKTQKQVFCCADDAGHNFSENAFKFSGKFFM